MRTLHGSENATPRRSDQNVMNLFIDRNTKTNNKLSLFQNNIHNIKQEHRWHSSM